MFAKGPSINTRLLVAMVLSFALLVIDQNGSRLAHLRASLSFAVYPILYLVDLPSKFVSEISDTAFSYVELISENKRLKEKQFMSDSKLLKFEALEKENIRLRSLLDSSYKIGEQMLVAEILSVNLAPFDHVVMVDKGSRFGLHDKQPVFDTQGVVGQVIRTLPLSSEIMLITDPNHAIPVQVNRNGLRTIAVGSGQLNKLILPFLPNNADIKPGDLLITSGMGGTFPQGYPVATVSSFEVQPHRPFAMIVATPKAALDKIREVFIVWSAPATVPLSLPPASSIPVTTANANSADEPKTAAPAASTTDTQAQEKVEKTIEDQSKINEEPAKKSKSGIMSQDDSSQKLEAKHKDVPVIKPEPDQLPDEYLKTPAEIDLEDSIVDDQNIPASIEKSEADAVELNKLLPDIRLDSPEADSNE